MIATGSSFFDLAQKVDEPLTDRKTGKSKKCDFV